MQKGIVLKSSIVACAAAMTVALAFVWSTSARAQAPQRGTLRGTVTANSGAVRGFRVTTHNLTAKIWYIVFTKDGHYNVPQALPGSYEVSVLEDGYDSPVQKVNLAPGQNLTVDIAVKKQSPDPSVTFLDYDQLYPPGAGRQFLEKNCMGCHGLDFYNNQHRTEAGWRAGINVMFNGPSFHDAPMFARNVFTADQKTTLVKYLAANFGIDSPNRQLKHDPYDADENVLSKAIYVEYDAPDMRLLNKTGNGAENAPLYGDPATGSMVTSNTGQIVGEGVIIAPAANAQVLDETAIGADGHIWISASNASEIVELDPQGVNPASRWKQFPIEAPDAPRGVYPHGITIDRKGHVYWAEVLSGRVGELDPETGKTIRHRLPTEGSLCQVFADANDNVWYTMLQGSMIGKVDAKTRRVVQWGTPTADTDPYGMVVDQKGIVWAAAAAKGLVLKFDPVAEEYTEYKTLTDSGVRRIGVDSKGIIWFSQYGVGRIGSLNPATGEMKEYKFPQRYTHPYDAWPDHADNIWTTDHFTDSMIKFDQSTQRFTYYPLPQKDWSVPKIEAEKNNTIWFGARGVEHVVAVHFYPNGYSAAAPAEP